MCNMLKFYSITHCWIYVLEDTGVHTHILAVTLGCVIVSNGRRKALAYQHSTLSTIANESLPDTFYSLRSIQNTLMGSLSTRTVDWTGHLQNEEEW